jgi:hypothetical protein
LTKAIRSSLLCFLILLFVGNRFYAQENQGLVFDNYSPVNGQFINPANIVDSKTWLDINLFGLSVFVSNNYFYYPKTTYYSFKSFDSEPLHQSNVKKVNAYINLLAQGPSASIVIGKRSFSIFSSLRAVGNAINLPTEIANNLVENNDLVATPGLYEFKNSRLKDIAWGEVGLSYGQIIKAEATTMITAGISLKRVFGFQNTSLIINTGTLLVVNQDSSILEAENLRYSFAQPDQNAGKGWGINLGMKYKKMKGNVGHYTPHSTSSHCEHLDYKYSIGVSLLDVGYINFRREAFYGDIDDYSITDSTLTEDDIYDELERLKKGDKFIAVLPTAISVQFDYNINDNIYLNASIVQRIPMKKSFGAEKGNLLVVSARYESKYFGFSLPVSLVNYQKVLVGMAFRLGFISIGTDHFLPFIFKQNISTASIYFNVKVPIIRSPPCRPRDKSNKVKAARYQKCATWE